MKKNYLKKIVIGCSILTVFGDVQSQDLVTIGAVYSIGGSFGAPGNLVKAGFYESNTNSVITIDSIPGDFSNFAYYADEFAYVHIGRASGHPSGGDLLVAYSVIESDNVVVENMNGAKDILVTNEHVAILKGFGTDDEQYLEVLDKNDLNTSVFKDSLNINTGGMTYDELSNSLLVSYTEDNFGVIKAYDLDTIGKSQIVMADTLLNGIKQLHAVENNIIGVAKNAYYDASWNEVIVSAVIFKYDLTTDSLRVLNVDNIVGSIKELEGFLVGDFGNGIARFDYEDWTMSNDLPNIKYTDFEIDANNLEIYSINTDFFSFGQITRTGLFDGMTYDSVSVDISGSSISLLQNFRPEAISDIFELFQDSSLVFDVTINDIDPDMSEGSQLNVTFENMFTPNGQILMVGDSIYNYIPTVGFVGVDSVRYTVYDSFNLTDTATVYFNVMDVSSISELNNEVLNVYPNPARDQITLVLANAEKAQVAVRTIDGKLVMLSNMNGSKTTLDVSGLPTGLYLVEIMSDESFITTTFEKL